ncbi:bacteriocin immunity protein [Liquorilactobacillus vini]|uniref:bacteriocin immunity protein n=1 Tax=Liquorilactobacillus vini TaxID=238015 RepID=UPI00030DC1E4|nr:bacteriocin immunity protein [Liquorilactobacillus vini]
MFNENNVQKSQEYIDRLIAILDNREVKSAKLNDIIDVLRQVSKKLSTAKNPEALVMRLINYIRSVSMAGRLHYSKEEENLIINLEMIGQKVGLNGQYMADFGDKSQFYSIFEQIPKH